MELRPNLPKLPSRMAGLEVDHRGYPVPYFVAWIDGKPDFRVIDSDKLVRCIEEDRCWLCGGRLTRHRAYVIGPMCAINRVSSEPASHKECAIFGATACPFLTMPKMERREEGLPEDGIQPDGMMIKRNPGVALVWLTKGGGPFPVKRPDGTNGVLFDVGEPAEVHWFARGRPATRSEVLASIEEGLPALRDAAAKDGVEGEKALDAAIERAQQYLPAEVARAEG